MQYVHFMTKSKMYNLLNIFISASLRHIGYIIKNIEFDLNYILSYYISQWYVWKAIYVTHDFFGLF